MSVILSKIFSREKGVWYAYVWDESDRLGFKKYLNYIVKQNLFVRKGEKLSVLYDEYETMFIHNKIRDNYLHNKRFVNMVFADLSKEWKCIGPYMLGKKHLRNYSQLRSYYNHLVGWWAAMAILFRLDLPMELAKQALEYRNYAEKYSDTMIGVWNNFFDERILSNLKNLITPIEAFSANTLSARKKRLILERKRGVALYNSRLYSLSKLKEILKFNKVKIESGTAKNISQLYGNSAFGGKVSGVVKVVLLNREIGKVNKGDILVADMTSPDYVTAMKKSAAVITDEGGITCHAAITARELKIPCVIGTKIATKVLKDGDKIEVDADSGVINIIS